MRRKRNWDQFIQPGLTVTEQIILSGSGSTPVEEVELFDRITEEGNVRVLEGYGRVHRIPEEVV